MAVSSVITMTTESTAAPACRAEDGPFGPAGPQVQRFVGVRGIGALEPPGGGGLDGDPIPIREHAIVIR
jgi:hypothetical protein